MVRDLVEWTFDFLHNVLSYAEALIYFALGGFRFTDPRLAARRRSTCAGCPLNQQDICQKCGCSVAERTGWGRVRSKIYFPEEQCPEGFWK